MTRRESVLASIVQALGRDRPVGVPLAERAALSAASELPSIRVYPVSEETVNSTRPTTQRALTVRVECRASGTPADSALEPLLAHIVRSLSGSRVGDPAVTCTEQGTEWEWDAGAEDYGLAVSTWLIHYLTDLGDIESLR